MLICAPQRHIDDKLSSILDNHQCAYRQVLSVAASLSCLHTNSIQQESLRVLTTICLLDLTNSLNENQDTLGQVGRSPIGSSDKFFVLLVCVRIDTLQKAHNYLVCKNIYHNRGISLTFLYHQPY